MQLTRALGLEWAPYGVPVNAILPGPCGTDMNRPLLDTAAAYLAFVSQIPLDRWNEPAEIAGLVIFLASAASSFMRGTGITIDGGWTAR